MVWFNKRAFFLPLLFSLSACETLSVTPITSQPVSGVVYALPLTTFDITLERQLTSCKKGEVKVSNKPNAVNKSIEDVENLYRIDPQSLSSFLNTSTFDITFHEGTRFIKVINASATDATTELLTSVVKAVSSVSTVGLSDIKTSPAIEGLGAQTQSVPGGNDPSAPLLKLKPKIIVGCNPELIEALKAATAQQKEVNRVTAALTAYQQALIAAQAEQAAQLPNPTDAVNTKVANTQKQVKRFAADLESKTKQLEVLLKPIKSVVKVTWPTMSSSLEETELLRIPEKTVRAWFTVNTYFGELVSNPQPLSQDQIDEARDKLDVTAAITRAEGNIGRDLTNSEQAWRTDVAGLYYRNPLPGYLIFTEPCSGGDDCIDTRKVIKKQAELIAQLGFVNSLTVENQLLESSVFAATFSPNGALLTTDAKRTKALASSLASLVGTSSEEFVKFKTAQQGQEQTALTKELELLTSKLKILQAEKDLTEFGKDESEELDALNTEKTLLDAKVAVLTARAQLKKLEGGE